MGTVPRTDDHCCTETKEWWAKTSPECNLGQSSSFTGHNQFCRLDGLETKSSKMVLPLPLSSILRVYSERLFSDIHLHPDCFSRQIPTEPMWLHSKHHWKQDNIWYHLGTKQSQRYCKGVSVSLVPFLSQINPFQLKIRGNRGQDVKKTLMTHERCFHLIPGFMPSRERDLRSGGEQCPKSSWLCSHLMALLQARSVRYQIKIALKSLQLDFYTTLPSSADLT